EILNFKKTSPNFPINFRHQRKPIFKYIKQYSIVVHQVFQLFVTVVNLFVVCSQYDSLRDLHQFNSEIFQTLTGFTVILLTELRLLLFTITVYMYAHSNILPATFCLIALEILRLKLRQFCIENYHNKKRFGKLKLNLTLAKFKIDYTSTM